MNRLIPLMLILTLAGCGGPRRDLMPNAANAPSPAVLGQTEDETVVLLVLDLSGSFSERMANEGEGYKFAVNVVDKYFRNKVGTQDKLVIAQISGTDRSLLWEGTPMELKRQFPTPDVFRDFLMKKADPNGSQVHKGLRNALQYVLSDRRVAEGKSKVAVLVLSDMIDSSNDSNEEGYMNHEISVLGLQKGVMGVYFAEQQQCVRWRHKLANLNVKNFVVLGEITGTPTMPNFEN